MKVDFCIIVDYYSRGLYLKVINLKLCPIFFSLNQNLLNECISFKEVEEMLKDEDWFFYVGFSSLNLNGKEMKIFLEAVTEKSEERVKNLGNFGGLRVYEKNSRHSIWLSNLDSVSVGIIDLTFFTFTLTAANHHPFPPPSQLFFIFLSSKFFVCICMKNSRSAIEQSSRM